VLSRYRTMVNLFALIPLLTMVGCLPHVKFEELIHINDIVADDLIVSEEGDLSAYIRVYLSTKPTADVVFPVASSDESELLLSKLEATDDASEDPPEEEILPKIFLTFTPQNYFKPQAIRLHGNDDFLLDGDQNVQVQFLAAISEDARYNGLVFKNYDVLNEDNDNPGVTMSGIELDGVALSQFALAGQPLTGRNIASLSFFDLTREDLTWLGVKLDGVSLGDIKLGELVLLDGDLVETNNTYKALLNAALINRTLLQIAYPDGDEDEEIAKILSSVKSDEIWLKDIAFKEKSLTDFKKLTTSEDGTHTIFSVVMNTSPDAEIKISMGIFRGNLEGKISLDDNLDNASDVITLSFDETNWNVSQSITVFGLDDTVVDGNIRYTIITSNIESEDENYNGIKPKDIEINNIDNDEAMILVEYGEPLIVKESNGESGQLSIVLNTSPQKNREVAINVASSAPDFVLLKLVESDAEASELLTVEFTEDTWDISQHISLVAQKPVENFDFLTSFITFSESVSGDRNFNRLRVPDVAVNNLGEIPGIFIYPQKDLLTSESGEEAEFSVRLTHAPLEQVSLSFSTDNALEGILSGGDSPSAAVNEVELNFSTSDWSTLKPVKIHGVDDASDDTPIDGNQNFTIVSSLTTSDDPDYNDIVPNDVAVTNIDNDAPGITVTPVDTSVDAIQVSEAQKIGYFTVVLNRQPNAEVVLTVAVDEPTEGQLLANLGSIPSTRINLSYTPENWSTEQKVYIRGIRDGLSDKEVPFNVFVSVNRVDTIDTTGYATLNEVPDVVIAVESIDDE